MPDAGATALVERFHQWLRERHLPVTRQRDLVARVVLAGGGHLSVEAIQRRLRGQGHHVGTATIYRALEVLVRSGLVRAHDFGDGHRRYEPVTAGTEHGHLVCSRCGSVAEFAADRLERALAIIADEHGFHHHRQRVELHGTCRTCREADFGALARVARR